MAPLLPSASAAAAVAAAAALCLSSRVPRPRSEAMMPLRPAAFAAAPIGSPRRRSRARWRLFPLGETVEAEDAVSCPSEQKNKGDALAFRIGEARYSDLARAADLMTDGFYPDLIGNPVLRPIRYLMELERLQGNFPYDDDGSHFYLAAYEDGGAEGSERLIGFCDVDGRVPGLGGGGLASLPFFKRVVRPQPYFSDLAVHPERRRRGVARALMAEAERRARGMGYEEIYLGVRSTNDAALRMYSEMGYEIIVPSGDMVAFLEIQKDVKMLMRSLG